jgi:type IV secretory pathway TraG/TraD family ATPase VirD4
MLDEFAALGRLDFFESQLAFMAGYGIRSFLITQSLNQLERAYGANHAIVISALRFRQMTSAPQSACRMRSGPPPKCAR